MANGGAEEAAADGEKADDAPAAPAAAPAPDEPMDVNTAVQLVLKKALAHDGLARGLHEAARALDRGEVRSLMLSVTLLPAGLCQSVHAGVLQRHL